MLFQHECLDIAAKAAPDTHEDCRAPSDHACLHITPTSAHIHHPACRDTALPSRTDPAEDGAADAYGTYVFLLIASHSCRFPPRTRHCQQASSHPLHHAAKARTPEQEIRQLIEENPGAARQTDDEGRLPLHHAASSALLPPLAVRALVAANPDALLAPEDNRDGNLPLHLAAMCRPPLGLIELLLEGTSGREAASRKNSGGRLPLHAAAEHNAPPEALRALIDANPEALLQGDRYLDLPLHLHCAASGGRTISPEAVALLLEGRGREAAATRDLYRCLPLHFAAEWRAPPEALGALVDANPAALLEGDGLNRTPLHILCASTTGRASPGAVMALLLGEGGREAAARRDLHGRLPLHWAAHNRAPLEVLRALIEANPGALLAGDVIKGSAILAGNESSVIRGDVGPNRLPLHVLCAAYASPEGREGEEASPEAVALLLEGSGREAAARKDSDGSLPLHLAVSERDPPLEVVRALVEANPGALLEEGRDRRLPVHCAAESRASAEVVALLLLREEAAAAARDAGGRLPLHLAAEKGAPLGSLRALIDAHPAALLEEDAEKNLPLHCAAWGRASAEAVALLLEEGGQGGLGAAARRDSRGRFPLHLAAKNRAPLEAVRALLEAHPEALLEGDLHMILPLHYAASGQASLEVVALLLEGRGREAAATKSLFDRLPLHLAAETMASPGVVRALMDANPEALLQGAVSGSLPLHLHLAAPGVAASPGVVALLLEGRGREAALKKDTFGRLPLHLAAEWRAPAGVVRALLELNPAALLAADRRGSLPLHLHCGAVGEASAEVLAALLEGRGREAAAARDGRGRLALHLAARDNFVAGGDNEAPVEAFRALIEANPGALLEEDGDKDLPIHVYLKGARGAASAEVVALLLEGGGREAAARKGSGGRLPLHLVADRRAPLGVVRALLEANPGALVEGDGKGSLPGDLAKRDRAPEEVIALLSPPTAAAAERR